MARSAAARPLRRTLRPLLEHLEFPVPARLHTGQTCYVSLQSAIGRGLFVTGTFDPGLTRVFAQTMRGRSGTFLDVGANVGYFSLLWMHLTGGCPAHAFEVDPRAIRCLERTKVRGGYAGLSIHGCAVGEKADRVKIGTSGDTGHTFLDYSQGASGPSYEVRALDSFADETGKVSAIKIDVEGAELAVLRGALGILRKHRPVVLCESTVPTLGRYGTTARDLIGFMSSAGYDATAIDDACDANLLFTPAAGSTA